MLEFIPRGVYVIFKANEMALEQTHPRSLRQRLHL
jgi:hypothetical protein